jgi:predicted MFS family arabinose efflux permease
MMWPGSLVAASKRVPAGGVFMYAMMAAGGDFGASVGPQLVGLVTDFVSASGGAVDIASALNLTVEQLGMKVGMLVGTIFPLIAIVVFAIILKTKKKHQISIEER